MWLQCGLLSLPMCVFLKSNEDMNIIWYIYRSLGVPFYSSAYRNIPPFFWWVFFSSLICRNPSHIVRFLSVICVVNSFPFSDLFCTYPLIFFITSFNEQFLFFFKNKMSNESNSLLRCGWCFSELYPIVFDYTLIIFRFIIILGN